MFETRPKGSRKRGALPAIGAALALMGAVASTLTGCGGASFDPTTSLGKRAIIDQANLLLSRADCQSAIALIKPVYNSEETDNTIRMLMASSYACEANVNLFKVMGDLLNNAAAFTGSGFWEFLAREFPSALNDRRAEAAQLSQDALHSLIHPGAVILPANLYNVETFNPGALYPLDRITDANPYLFFVSLAAIGAFENRYGNPYPNGKKGQNLPWTTPATVDRDGCAYASALVNFVDALGGAASMTQGSLSTALSNLQITFQAGIYSACDSGCTSKGLPSCPTCPAALRNRTSCTSVNTDPSSSAAAGIVNFINSTPLIGWETGP